MNIETGYKNNVDLPGITAHTCKSSTWEEKAGGSRVQGHLQLYSKFKAAWLCKTLSQKGKKKKGNLTTGQAYTLKLQNNIERNPRSM